MIIGAIVICCGFAGFLIGLALAEMGKPVES